MPRSPRTRRQVRYFSGQELNLLPSYGDLRDCRKIYFGLLRDQSSQEIRQALVQYLSLGGSTAMLARPLSSRWIDA